MGQVDQKAVFHVLKKGDGKRYEKYSLENKCHYELHWYPFDTQQCHIEIAPFSDLKKFVELVTEDFIYEGPMELTTFVIKR